MDKNKDFKCVWISEKFWLSKKLGVTEKLLLTKIDSLSNNPQGCFASNIYLGDFLGLTKESVSNMVSKLAKQGFITVKLIYKENSKEIMKRLIKINDICEQSQDVTESIEPTHNKKGTTSNDKNDIIRENDIISHNDIDISTHNKMDTPTHKSMVIYPQKDEEPTHKNVVDTNSVYNRFNNTTTTSESSNEVEKKEPRNSSSNFIELLFLKKKEYSQLNFATRCNINKALPNLTEVEFKKIYNLTVEEIKSGYGKFFNAVLYKGLKNEWNFEHTPFDDSCTDSSKIVLEPEKAEWLRCFSGIKSSPDLYDYVKKSIVKIPMETLRLNKRKIGMMPTYELKKHIALLVRNSL